MVKWFKIWNEIYKDEKKEYENPHLKWIFSEIAISPILLDKRFKDIISLKKPAYEYFYNIEVENKNFMEIINEIYNENSIKDFMIKGFEFCRKYESEIRAAMY